MPAGVVANGATSASIELKTVGDRYLPGVVFFRTDIYAPEMVLHKTVTDVNGGEVNPGDVLEYSVSSTNTGISSAYNAQHRRRDPARTRRSSPARSRSSRAPAASPAPRPIRPTDDQAEFDGAGNAVRFRIGTGAGAGAVRTTAAA